MRIATRRGSIIASSVSLDMHEVFTEDSLWLQAPRFMVAVTRLLLEAGSPRVNDDHEVADEYDLVRRSSMSLHRVSPKVLACAATNHVGGRLSLGMQPCWRVSRENVNSLRDGRRERSKADSLNSFRVPVKVGCKLESNLLYY